MVKGTILPLTEQYQHQRDILNRDLTNKLALISHSQSSSCSDCSNQNYNTSTESSMNSSCSINNYSTCLTNLNNQTRFHLQKSNSSNLDKESNLDGNSSIFEYIKSKNFQTPSNSDRNSQHISVNKVNKQNQIMRGNEDNNYLKIPSMDVFKESSSSTIHNLEYSISKIISSNSNSPETTSQVSKFTPPPTPPNKIQITTPFGSNEIILIDDNGQKIISSNTNDESIFFSSDFSNSAPASVCCLCYNEMPGGLPKSTSQIINNKSSSYVKTPRNLPKNFKMNASPNFNSKNSIDLGGSKKIFFKTTRSKSYSCQWIKPRIMDQNLLNASYAPENYSLCSSYQSFSNDDKNKLSLPMNNFSKSSVESINSIQSDNNICTSCSSLGQSINSLSQPMQPLSSLCSNKMHISHSMYNFDVAEFPEFNYIKKHMLHKETCLIADSGSLVDSFLKNFDKSLNDINIEKEKVKTLKKFTFNSMQSRDNGIEEREKQNESIKPNSLFNKSSSKLTTQSVSPKSSRSKLKTEGLKNKLRQKVKLKDCRSDASEIMDPDFTYKKDKWNYFFEDNLNRRSSHSFLGIYSYAKQSHSTGALDTTTSNKHNSKAKEIDLCNLSNPKSAFLTNKTSKSNKNTEQKEKEPKSHLFDFYSYYNNKYNQENQRKKNSRSTSMTTANSIVQHFKSRDFKTTDDSMHLRSFYIDDSDQFNMRKFASAVAKDIKSKASNLLRRRHTDASISDKGILPSRDEYMKWQTSFENLLRHKYGIALFRGFLKTEFSDENIEFWIECEDYKFINKELKREAKAKKIYSDFVAIGSPREVNLDIEIRAHTAQKILNPSYDTFDRAQKRITALMEKDSYPRFLESDLYKNLISNYNSSNSNGPPLTSRNSLTSNNSFNESLPSTSNKSLSYSK